MDFFVKYFMLIISAYLNNNTINMKTDDVDFAAVYELAKRHNIVNFLYHSLKHNQVFDSLNDDLKKLIFTEHKKSIFLEAKQEIEYNILKDRLIKEKIFFMPIKGINYKNIFPNIDVRTMSDVDLLVEKNSIKNIKVIMNDLGYSISHVSVLHDSYFKPPAVSIEIHVSLLEEEFVKKSKDTVFSLKDGVLQNNGYEYRLSKEQEYVYIIAHSAHHFFSSGGIGIKNMIDVYWYNLYFKNELDRDYIKNKLIEISLFEFEQGLVKLSKIWFEGTKSDKVSNALSDNILTGGVYGTLDRRFAHRMLLKGEDIKIAKRKKTIEMIFPPTSHFKGKYRWITRHQYLLPFLWISRWFKIIFRGKKSLDTAEKIFNVSTKEMEKLNFLYTNLGLK